MDVYGIRPTSEAGRYFRLNWTGWQPLADYIATVAPDIYAKCEHWHSNDGDGLNAADALALADALDATMDTDAMKRAAAMAAEEDARLCEQYRRDGWTECVACSESWLPNRVGEFAAFLRGCGGFQLW
jgi:hypothetical protein